MYFDYSIINPKGHVLSRYILDMDSQETSNKLAIWAN